MMKLDFGFLSCEDILEATVKEGFYHIYCDFSLTAYLNRECYELGQFKTIYEALDAANVDYAERVKFDLNA